MKPLDLNNIVDIAVRKIIENRIFSLQGHSLNRSLENIFFKISERIYGNNSTKENFKETAKLFFWWKRNTYDFRKLVEEKISLVDSDISNTEKFEIKLSQSTWLFLQNFKKTYLINDKSGKIMRKKFSTEFDDYISKILQDKGIMCWMRSKYNWFRSENSQKNSVFWRGKFNCLDPECNNTFNLTIEKQEFINDIVIKIDFTSRYQHKEKFNPRPRCFGKSRTEEAKKIMCMAYLTLFIII